MALKPFLFSEFRKSFFLHRREFKPEILQEVRPDVVVLQFAERYTACMASELDWESLFEPTISP